MKHVDYFVLIIYGAGILLIGSILSRKNKTTADMFAVRKQSPWWLSGLSSFMSAFSAGTFVVWGGIAYKQGMVAVSILMCSGVASFFVGRFFAGKWASLNIGTVGEYVQMRFGKEAVQFYTWVGMCFKIVAMGVALYSFAVVVSSLIPLAPDNWLADPYTHKLSVPITIVLSGAIMLMYAVSGGLWAVLIIDAIQFVVLTITVLFVVPLSLANIGGLNGFLHQAPAGFLNFSSGGFTYIFLIGWAIVHTFKLGGEWVFVQRFLSVSSAKNARKSSNLMAILYILSPIIWMLPPMIFRIGHPGAKPEQAYILACAAVLPAGMMGLLIAAMFSSAASYIDGEVNVYAAAVTNDVYKNLINPNASNNNLMLVGRASSMFIGIIIIIIAISIPAFGGAEQIIITITGLLGVAMVLPVLWGLYFSGIKQNAIWWSTGFSIIVAILLKKVIPASSNNIILQFYYANTNVIEVFIGLGVPLISLCVLEVTSRHPAVGFAQIQGMIKQHETKTDEDHAIATFPAQLLGYSIGALSLIMFGLVIITSDGSKYLIALFAAILLSLSLLIIFFVQRLSKKSTHKI